MLVCSPYKFFGPHLGLAFARRRAARALAAVQGAAAPNEPFGHRFETGTQPHELLAGFVAAVEYVESIGWDAIPRWERTLGERFLTGLPDGCRLHGLPTMDGRVPTFAFTVDGPAAGEVGDAARRARLRRLARQLLRARDMKRLGLEDGGAVRAGLVHYNTRRRGRPAARGARPARVAVAGRTIPPRRSREARREGGRRGRRCCSHEPRGARAPVPEAAADARARRRALGRMAEEGVGDRDRPDFEAVQEIGLANGLVDNKSCAVDEDWQALRFVYRLADRPTH